MQTFPIEEVLAVSCAAHRINDGFIKKIKSDLIKNMKKQLVIVIYYTIISLQIKSLKLLQKIKRLQQKLKNILQG